MSLLNELGIKHKTDKGTHGKRGEPGKGHNYLRTYERHLPADRHMVRRVLEIGVQRGSSIRMWEEYFPNAQIYGLDIAETALSVTGERITIGLVDQSDAAALDAFAREFGPFDLIVEDGSHIWSHQIISLQTLLQHVAPRGRYIVEDLHTSFSPEFGTGGGVTGIHYVLSCCEKILGAERVRTDDAFLNVLHEKVDSVMVMRNAAMFFCR
jgi:trans-aconitate methyltransferase